RSHWPGIVHADEELMKTPLCCSAGAGSISHQGARRSVMRVLVVEDEPKMAGLLHRGLVEEGYAVDVATNGTDGYAAAVSCAYDAVVLDAMLPGLSGFEVCRRLRQDKVWVPVLMLTARAAVSDRICGLDGGADDYLTKPFHLAELFARLRALTRRGPVAHPT